MRLISAAVMCALVATGVACGDSSGPSTGSGTNVSVVNNRFDPTTLNLSGGNTVTWTWNSGGTVHNVTFADGIGNSGDQGSGTHQRTFTVPGTYLYECTIHPGMSGSIVVP